jgi:hypothetical protein
VADEEDRGPLSEWLELMLAEITRRQEEAEAADVEQAARALQPSQRSTSDEPPMAASQPRPQAPSRPTSTASRTRATHRAKSA